MLLVPLGASLLRNLLIGKGTLMPPHPLTNLKSMQKYHQNQPKLKDVHSRNNLPKIKDGAYVINLDEYKSIGTHWIPLHVNENNIVYFDSFGV